MEGGSNRLPVRPHLPKVNVTLTRCVNSLATAALCQPQTDPYGSRLQLPRAKGHVHVLGLQLGADFGLKGKWKLTQYRKRDTVQI